MAKKANNEKGYIQEELLKSYFQKSGYFVIRSVPFQFRGEDVTDIDIWLYGKTSNFTREVIIVDSKNKKTPQAIERIFWVYGLKAALNANRAMVATTDKRPEVHEFGKSLGVVVLDGVFLSRLANLQIQNDRLTLEDFRSKIANYEFAKLDGDWWSKICRAKSLLGNGLSFDSCNEWLEIAKFFAEKALIRPNQKEVALRCLYLICSFISVSIDSIQRNFFYLPNAEFRKKMNEGFSFGSRGEAGFKRIVETTLSLVRAYSRANSGESIANEIGMNISKRINETKYSNLGEFFSKKEIIDSLFSVAKEFEKLAMNLDFISHENSSPELKSVLFCLLDYFETPRTL